VTRRPAAPLAPLPLREKNLQCQNCNMRVFWSFAGDEYRHSQTKGAACYPGQGPEVAHPRIR
jgi:hypothetical protein